MGNPKAWTKLQKDDTRPMTLHQKCTVKRRLIQFGIKKSYLKKKEYQQHCQNTHSRFIYLLTLCL